MIGQNQLGDLIVYRVLIGGEGKYVRGGWVEELHRAILGIRVRVHIKMI